MILSAKSGLFKRSIKISTNLVKTPASYLIRSLIQSRIISRRSVFVSRLALSLTLLYSFSEIISSE